MSHCIFAQTSNPEVTALQGTDGDLTIMDWNHAKWISFVSSDRTRSFRAKIATWLNDLERPGCTEAWYRDPDGYEYTFQNSENINPLWEYEHQKT